MNPFKENEIDKEYRMHGRKLIVKFLWEKNEGTRSYGRPRRRWEDNVKMDLEEI
jgi:hypothetical protein